MSIRYSSGISSTVKQSQKGRWLYGSWVQSLSHALIVLVNLISYRSSDGGGCKNTQTSSLFSSHVCRVIKGLNAGGRSLIKRYILIMGNSHQEQNLQSSKILLSYFWLLRFSLHRGYVPHILDTLCFTLLHPAKSKYWLIFTVVLKDAICDALELKGFSDF